jgi:type I restriction enzyme, S subunit
MAIADVLQAGEQVKQTLLSVPDAVRRLQNSLINSSFQNKWESWPVFRVDDVGQVQMGRQKSPEYTRGKCPQPYLRVGNIGKWRLDLRNLQEMDFDETHLEKYRLEAGDIVITEGDIVSPLNVGRSAMFNGEIDDCCFQNHLIRFRSGEMILPHYARAAFRYMHMRREFARAAKVTTITSLGVKRLSSMKIRVPSLAEQREIVSAANSVWDLDIYFGKRIEALASVQRRLLGGSM